MNFRTNSNAAGVSIIIIVFVDDIITCNAFQLLNIIMLSIYYYVV